jgi:DNA invertase Pin-like site-specific DNA recombinase
MESIKGKSRIDALSVESNPTETSTVKPKLCFSYIRFSSKKQELGSSLDRQEPIVEKVAKDKGWVYEPKFNAKDLGVSAFKGDNRKTLESIVECANKGIIPQGSVMVLEALDRATRLSVDEAQDLIKLILRSGIEIYTDSNSRHLTKASLNDITSVIITVVELDAAFQYSKKLSDRSRGGFKKLLRNALAGKKVYFGGSMPSYIKGEKDGEWVIDKKKRELVKRIFNEYLMGKSKSGIAKQLNVEFVKGEGTPSLSRSNAKYWTSANIAIILKNSSYTGDYVYQGVNLKDYLPQLISKKDFEKIQYLIRKNTKRRGGSPKGNVSSIFHGVAKCICGANMGVKASHYKYKGQLIKHTYFICNASREKACTKHMDGHWLKNEAIEAHFIMRLRKSPVELIGAFSQRPLVDNTIGLKAEIEKQKAIINDAVELLKKRTAVEVISKAIDEAQNEINKLEKQLQEETNARINISNESKNISKLNEMIEDAEIAEDDVEMGMIYTNIKKQLQVLETRQQLVNIIPTLVKEIKVNPQNKCYSVINHQGKESASFKIG